ncbi:hypothetical protein PIB30_030030 [Stylosanthes scabra]|uniref:Uncharacterized protein n=1 Tax=Stylosanthes scabra TaxID=79078 RepID=A0ABU6SBL9_9FABA|nr:hypothetical protein [Stylosanthes scabra]
MRVRVVGYFLKLCNIKQVGYPQPTNVWAPPHAATPSTWPEFGLPLNYTPLESRCLGVMEVSVGEIIQYIAIHLLILNKFLNDDILPLRKERAVDISFLAHSGCSVDSADGFD